MSGLGGITAVFVGVIYAYGATLKATALNGADVRVADTLPLVPIEQLLLLGIKGSIQLGGALLFSALVLVVTTSLEETRSKDRDDASPAEGKLSTGQAGLTWVSLIAICTGMLLLAPIPTAMTLVALLVLARLLKKERLGVRSFVVAIVLSYVLMNAGYEYVDSDPLPRVTLYTQHGTIRGDLIATNDGTWWLATGADHYRGIPDGVVDFSDLHSPNHTTKSVFNVIAGAW